MSNVRYAVAVLTISAAALVGIASQEGYRSNAYKDAVGIPTIGFGETKGVSMGQSTTPERALVRLLASADEHAKGMAGCTLVPLKQTEFDAYLSLTYNIGVGAYCNSTLVKKLNASDYEGACKEILRWDKAKGKALPGLTKRRKEEYRICMT